MGHWVSGSSQLAKLPRADAGWVGQQQAADPPSAATQSGCLNPNLILVQPSPFAVYFASATNRI